MALMARLLPQPGIPIRRSPLGTISLLRLSRSSKSLRRSRSQDFRPSRPPTSPMLVPSAINSMKPVRLMSRRFSSSKAGSDSGLKCPVAQAKNLQAPLELVEWVAEHGTLPVPNFSAGGIATPADAALVMQLGAEAVFVGSGIFKSSDPANRANAIVMAAKNYNNPEKLLEASRSLGAAMPGLEISKIPEGELLQTRGW